MTQERWIPVVGYEDCYEVSDLGRIRSLARSVQCGGSLRRIPQKILKWRTDDCSTGYVYVSLCRNGSEKKFVVHRLVLRAFVGPPGGMWALHRNGNRADPRLDNLYYGTPKENGADMIRHGNSRRGSKNTMALLSEELVRWIRESTQSSIELGALLGVHHSTIRKARARVNWSST